MQSKYLTPVSFSAAIKNSGIPHSPNPPTRSLELLGISATAAAALGKTLDDANRATFLML